MDKIYTHDEVAKTLLMTRRGIAKIAKRHSLCMATFTAEDTEGIKLAMRPVPENQQLSTVRSYAGRARSNPSPLNCASCSLSAPIGRGPSSA
ncbi:hypothetical protein EOA29_05905 [Mesorhizobium sp. M1E.F.Ca.ET.063.01.1.1]|nr:hypothetical protein EOA29_05905 [Mesorhizobium sp. M1E.F.Ca.ET.063.01.1.1]